MFPLIANTPYSMRFNRISAIRFSTKKEHRLNSRFTFISFFLLEWFGRDCERHLVCGDSGKRLAAENPEVCKVLVIWQAALTPGYHRGGKCCLNMLKIRPVWPITSTDTVTRPPRSYLWYNKCVMVSNIWAELVVALRTSPQNVALLAFLFPPFHGSGSVALRCSLGLCLDVSTDGANQTVTGLQLVQEHSAAEESK